MKEEFNLLRIKQLEERLKFKEEQDDKRTEDLKKRVEETNIELRKLI